MRIAIGSDHAGFALKTGLVEFIRGLGHEVADFGTNSLESCNYCDFGLAVAHSVADGENELGVLICGTGVGMSISANKVDGAYAARCLDCYSARMARAHNAANILCMGERVIGAGLAEDVVEVFLKTEPSQEARHASRRACVVNAERSRGSHVEPPA
jgi:ribose 5-phosphate isomerase B